MPIDVSVIHKTFGAMEVAKLTGVSQDSQRDWRRRGFFPQNETGHRVRHSILSLCCIALTKAQIENGKAIVSAYEIAKASAGAAATQIMICPQAVAFEGVPVADDTKRQIMRQAAKLEEGAAPTRYLFFPNHWSMPSRVLANSPAAPVTCYHFATLEQIEAEAQGNWTMGQLIDLQTFAADLAAMAGDPLITYHVSEGPT